MEASPTLALERISIFRVLYSGGVHLEVPISGGEWRRSPCDKNDDKNGLPVFS
jgi:hypothetical protein